VFRQRAADLMDLRGPERGFDGPADIPQNSVVRPCLSSARFGSVCAGDGWWRVMIWLWGLVRGQMAWLAGMPPRVREGSWLVWGSRRFKSVRGSLPGGCCYLVCRYSGWPAKQDHPAYLLGSLRSVRGPYLGVTSRVASDRREIRRGVCGRRRPQPPRRRMAPARHS
jgi:hypothetical protein